MLTTVKDKEARKQKLIENLEKCAKYEFGDPSYNHPEADKFLLEYINDPQVNEVWERIERWYA